MIGGHLIKFSKTQEQKLLCITGQCNHTYMAKTCLWNKITDAKDPDAEMAKEIKKLITEVVKANVNTIKTQKPKRATISKKKGK